MTASSLRCRSCSRATSSAGSRALDGYAVGVVGNQPAQMAGVLDIESSEKASRFIRTCDAFNVPILTFCDVPGFLPGTDAGVERDHPPRRQAALRLRGGDGAEADGDHPQVLRRRATDVMGSKHLGADMNFAWPTAEVAVMGAEGAVNIHLPARDRRCGRPRGRSARSGSRSTRRTSPTPTSPPSAATSTT